jgi:hypothetical protein
MSDVKKQFEARLGRFGRVRRAVKNGAMAYGTGVLALGVGVGALILLRGWTWSSSPFVNAGIDAIPTAIAAILLVWLLARLVRRWERRRNTLSEAFHAEELEGDLNSRLVSAADFLDWPQRTSLTDVVIEKAIRDLERPFENRLDHRARNRVRWQFAGALAIFVLLGLTPWFGFKRVGNTVRLCAANLREFLLPTRFEVFPGNKVFLIGAKADAGLQFTRFRYPRVTMLTEHAEQDGVTTNILTVTASGRAAESLQPTVERQYRIRFAFGNRVTEPMLLTFTTSPMIENMQVELVYPRYTRLMPNEIEGVVDRVTAIGGTRVNLGYVFTKPLKSAVLTFEDGTNSMRMPLDVVARFASVSFVHSRESRAQLQVEDIHGFGLDNPQAIEFGLTADNPPKIFPSAFLKQDMPCTIEDLAGFTFGARVEDDFGASRCRVTWQQSTAEDPNREIPGEPVERVFIPPRPTVVATFENIFRDQAQALMEKGPQGNVFKFQIEAFDNREPKPQMTVSLPFSIFIKQQMDVVGLAGSGMDISGGGRFNRGGQKATRRVGQREGPRGIGMPEKLDTAGLGTDYTGDRIEGGVRGSRAGGTDSTQKAYAEGLSGSK